MTTKDVLEVVSAMKNKLCELDAMPMALLKKILPRCIDTIMQLVNISLTTGEFYLEWKTTVVRPLLKKTCSRTSTQELQTGIQLLLPLKASQKYMLKQLMRHCKRYNLLLDFLSADRRNYSTETSLIRMVNDILWGMEKQEITMVIILDPSSVFNTVDHDVLLVILEKQFSFCKRALEWFNNYLWPRVFKVCVDGRYSEARELKFSVPQGSFSRATLFTCYCLLFRNIAPENININGFADDHSIIENILYQEQQCT